MLHLLIPAIRKILQICVGIPKEQCAVKGAQIDPLITEHVDYFRDLTIFISSKYVLLIVANRRFNSGTFSKQVFNCKTWVIIVSDELGISLCGETLTTIKKFKN